MPVSEKKRRSNDAYNAKCDVIQIRPIKPVGAAIRAAAQAAGQSLQSYIVEACADRMRRDRASAGRESVTRLSHSSCTGTSGICAKSSTVAKKMVIISPMLQESR